MDEDIQNFDKGAIEASQNSNGKTAWDILQEENHMINKSQENEIWLNDEALQDPEKKDKNNS